MNISKRFTAVILSLVFVFSAGISSIAHAGDEVTGNNVISITTVSSRDGDLNVYEKVAGSTWENSFGYNFKLIYRSKNRVHLEFIDESLDEDDERNIFIFNMITGEVRTRDVGAENGKDDLVLSHITISETQKW